MSLFSLLINNFQIILQVIFWFVIFYWLDFDLFTYILNENHKLKVVLGILLGCSHLFLFRYLYQLFEVDSIFIPDNANKELENISEKHDFTSCRKCNVFRPRRTHHCQYCNKCILDMDHHCFSLNKCIGKNNYNIYIKYLIFVELNTSLIFGSCLYVCYNYYNQLNIYTLIKYALLCIASFLGSTTLYLYLLFQTYLYCSNLTTLEFLYPKLRINN